MRITFLTLFMFVASLSIAQTPIDGLQKNNLEYLESKEGEGYEFRSQIITEFDQAHASQDVNIKLSKDYTYVVVAIGDSNIPEVSLAIKTAKNASTNELQLKNGVAGQAVELKPGKSGRFKISINAKLSAGKTGFISFMVLRK